MQAILKYLFEIIKALLSTQNLARIIAVTVFKLSSFRAWLASLLIKKVIDKTKDKLDDRIDTIDDNSATERLKKEMLKDLKDIDWALVDKLEREIHEGKK